MELSKHSEYHIFDLLIDNNLHFALYKLPGKEVTLVLQHSGKPHTFKRLSQLNSLNGFVIAPYQISGSCPIILIEPEVVLHGEDAIFNYLSGLTLAEVNINRDRKLNFENIGSSSFSHYQEVYDRFREELTEGVCQKLVLSRTFDTQRCSSFSPGLSFLKAYQQYPDSFTYLSHTPNSGTWLGCSPERLVSSKDGHWTTDALAGTQKIEDNNTSITWDDKNRLEQQIVVDYMQQQLSKAGIPSTHNNAETIQAGNLLHIRSEFSFDLNDPSKIGDVLDLLHPSPAINGFPKDEAFQFIQRNERYNRKYYSGFIGYLDPKGDTNLYVNLRCMEILDYSLRLYAGGGILSSSDLFSEWKETENKLQTILSVIDNNS